MKRTAVYCATFVVTTIAFADVTITGTIIDGAKGTPVAGALVTLQATSIRTTTNKAGIYSLTIPGDYGSIIVGAGKGYFNSPTTFTGTPTGLNITLEPVPQEDNPYYPNESAVEMLGDFCNER